MLWLHCCSALRGCGVSLKPECSADVSFCPTALVISVLSLSQLCPGMEFVFCKINIQMSLCSPTSPSSLPLSPQRLPICLSLCLTRPNYQSFRCLLSSIFSLPSYCHSLSLSCFFPAIPSLSLSLSL